jgi:hypothetical protein
MVALEEWFLTPTERGNGATRIDHGASARGWSEGNQVELLVHGCAYFTRLLRESAALGPATGSTSPTGRVTATSG